MADCEEVSDGEGVSDGEEVLDGEEVGVELIASERRRWQGGREISGPRRAAQGPL